MNAVVPTAAGLALGVAAAAAVYDWRRGEIPNWLTLPPVVLAPSVYGFAFGSEHALHSLAAAFLGGLVPYVLFRCGAMGGGDVKLFAALGAITGFDLLIGVEIQIAALLVALVTASGALAWKGRLLGTIANALVVGLGPLLPLHWRRMRCVELSTPIRMGGSIFVATGLFAGPQLVLAWSAP